MSMWDTIPVLGGWQSDVQFGTLHGTGTDTPYPNACSFSALFCAIYYSQSAANLHVPCLTSKDVDLSLCKFRVKKETSYSREPFEGRSERYCLTVSGKWRKVQVNREAREQSCALLSGKAKRKSRDSCPLQGADILMCRMGEATNWWSKN